MLVSIRAALNEEYLYFGASISGLTTAIFCTGQPVQSVQFE